MEIDTYGISQESDIGGRAYMEDQVFARFGTTLDGSRFFLLAVADGMGGHSNGAAASQETIEQIAAAFEELKTLEVDKDYRHKVNATICSAIQEAHKNMSKAGDAYDNRGSTVCVCFCNKNLATFYNVGDSYGFVFEPSLRTITVAHEDISSWGQEFITRSLGSYPTYMYGKFQGAPLFIEIDIFDYEITDDVTLVVATDGIGTPALLEKQIIKNQPLRLYADILLCYGLEAYSSAYKHANDNIAVACLSITMESE
jgi:serine/threonine protein phosphatase PrpC